MKKIWGLLFIMAFLTAVFNAGGGGCSHSSYVEGFEVKVLGNSSFLAGSRGAFRIITFDPSNNAPVGGIPVQIYLNRNPKAAAKAEEKTAEPGAIVDKPKNYGDSVFQGKTDGTGSLDASFNIPADAEGMAKLIIVAGIQGKSTDVETDISIKKQFKIYLTTDKPLYQPGQEMHIRGLALNVPSLEPVAESEAVIEVMDAKGNKVFKQKGKTTRYGVVFARFQLADEVNMGDYTVRVMVDKESQEKNVQVKRYVLPKFKVGFTKDSKFYRPGDTLKGEVQADYFFGKPVSGGKVTVRLFTFDTEFRQAVELKGNTDEKGHYTFEMKLPDYLVGQPLEKGRAMARLDIHVTDTADHSQTAIQMIPVSGQGMTVQFFPESGILRRGLENKIFVLAGYPDGSPAKATINLTVEGKKQTVVTDETGISFFTFTPPVVSAEEAGEMIKDKMMKPESIRPRRSIPVQEWIPVAVEASDAQGNKMDTTVNLQVNASDDNVILRTDKSQYQVGQTMNLSVFTTKNRGNIYLDFIRNNQTVLTKAHKIEGSQQRILLEVTPAMAGMLTIHAYRITDENQIIRDTRNVYVKDADDLKISVKPDMEVYKPGQEARINFTIVDKSGRPVQAAMGVDIVDEAVFAMGEMMPGLEKVYFLLEKQLMEPKYEIHGVTLKDAVLEPVKADDQRQTVRQLVFSQIPSEQQFSVNINTYDKKLDLCYEKMIRINQALYQYYRKYKKWPAPGDLEILVNDNFLKADEILDPWGKRFFLANPADERQQVPDIVSAGPKGIVGDKNDIHFSYLQTTHHMRYYSRRRDFMAVPAGALHDDVKLEGGLRAKGQMMDAPAEANELSKSRVTTTETGAVSGAKKQVRIREYFPETLYTNPNVITDEKGNAFITLQMADSITTWRLSAFANSIAGKMGNTTSGIRVFQDFFIDIDFPVALTQNDQVSVPVAVYNYLKEDQTVKLTVDVEDWFELLDKKEKSLPLKPDQVDVVYFRIKVKKLGNHKLTIKADGTKFSDAVRREIRILPDGRQVEFTKSDKLNGQLSTIVKIPENAIPGASKILVRIYPGVVSQVIEGLDKMLRMPNGCFEQTTATTYPNVLVLDYMTKMKKITPEIQMKAEGYINTGYQRLVSFEVQGGGFSWFGQAPANQCLTALGILQFRDMSRVHTVDEALITRTQGWLAGKQNQDGSWSPDANYLHADTWSKMQGGGKVPVTAYIVWALAESGYKGNDLSKGIEFLKKNSGQINDPYILALVCNALAQVEPKGQLTKKLTDKLAKMAKIEKDSAYWSTGVQTATYTTGDVATIETTALAALALLKAESHNELATKAINRIVQSKDSFGTWYSTQSSVLAMKALLLAQEKSTAKLNAKVKISVNGGKPQEFEVNSDNYDVYRQADFGDVTKTGDNKVEIVMEGQGSCYYQVAARHFVPWKQGTGKVQPLSIDVKYDRSALKADDTLQCMVNVRNNTKAAMKMVMIDIGVPPGFTVMTPDLDELVGRKFEKYNLTSRQLIIYTDTIKGGENISFKYRLKAKYPLRAQTPESRAYQYYNPKIQDYSRPVTLEVK